MTLQDVLVTFVALVALVIVLRRLRPASPKAPACANCALTAGGVSAGGPAAEASANRKQVPLAPDVNRPAGQRR